MHSFGSFQNATDVEDHRMHDMRHTYRSSALTVAMHTLEGGSVPSSAFACSIDSAFTRRSHQARPVGPRTKLDRATTERQQSAGRIRDDV
ncbi:hypothetical protein [Actinopolymorpha pittospori]|uniref:Uncharacterized protein n=1 Tax=Actinopolymorpha pittospori TaxID=648752 RepID=A0A927MX16_9ACTN|nr:hypothetical protein [Actinopolymorpha pittospori]MBE1608495.1 hypothetical protein [Actinopolymorpha pittospori]